MDQYWQNQPTKNKKIKTLRPILYTGMDFMCILSIGYKKCNYGHLISKLP